MFKRGTDNSVGDNKIFFFCAENFEISKSGTFLIRKSAVLYLLGGQRRHKKTIIQKCQRILILHFYRTIGYPHLKLEVTRNIPCGINK